MASGSASSMGIIWELVGNAESWEPPRPTESWSSLWQDPNRWAYTLQFEKCCYRPASRLAEQSWLQRLPPDCPPSAQQLSPSSFRVVPSRSRFSRSTVPHIDCTLKSLGELLKTPMLKPHPWPIKSESVEMEPRHGYFMKFPPQDSNVHPSNEPLVESHRLHLLLWYSVKMQISPQKGKTVISHLHFAWE